MNDYTLYLVKRAYYRKQLIKQAGNPINKMKSKVYKMTHDKNYRDRGLKAVVDRLEYPAGKDVNDMKDTLMRWGKQSLDHYYDDSIDSINKPYPVASPLSAIIAGTTDYLDTIPGNYGEPINDPNGYGDIKFSNISSGGLSHNKIMNRSDNYKKTLLQQPDSLLPPFLVNRY